MPHILLQGLSKSFGSVRAVQDLTLEVQPRTHHLLTGPSGSGKSTTLRLLAGLETPDAGRIFIDGIDVTSRPPEQRQCGWVAQSPGLLPHLDVQSQLELPLRLRGLASPDRAARAQVLADRLGLTRRLHHRPADLSAGEAARAALGRALISQPALLLLDEPFAHLDPSLRRELRLLLREFQQDHELTILHVTHHPGEILPDATRITALNQGQLLQTGSPDSFYNQPRSLWLADLLGDCPVWKCRPGEAASSGLHLPDGLAKATTEELLGIRPESVTLQPSAPVLPPYLGPVRIHRIAHTGPRTWIECRWPDNHRIELPIPPGNHGWKVGDTAWLVFGAGSILRFSPGHEAA